MRHKEFGHRSGTGSGARENLRSIQGVSYEGTDEEVVAGASKLRKMVFWIGAAALLIGIYVGTKGSGQGLSQYWKKNSGPAVAQSYIPVDPKVKDVHLDKANNTCRARGDAAGRGHTVRQAAAYVACLAAESPRRLCQATHRTHFLAAMTNYYRLQAKDREIKISAEVVDAIKGVVSNGFIPKRDLIATGQGNLDTVLSGIEPKKSGC